jgi:CHC2 zinc finger
MTPSSSPRGGLDYARLRAMIPMRRVLSELHFHPVAYRGDQWRGACPLHTSGTSLRRDRRFSVHVGKNAFRCYCCGARGNQLDLWAAFLRQPLYPASLALCARLGMDPPFLPSTCNRQPRTP